MNTTFRVRVGGQRLDDLSGVQITGKDVRGRVIEYRRQLGNQETRILRDQMNELRKITSRRPAKRAGGKAAEKGPSETEVKVAKEQLARIQERLSEYVQRPACGSIANIAIIEVTVSNTAEPGERELRLSTLSGVSNPMPFHIGRLPEVSRKPLATCEVQVLGKEERALNRRPPEESETRVSLPCTVNGQISPGEVDRFRFVGRKGQKLAISTLARQLVPFIADAVPGWFQPVLTLQDTTGKEVAYEDDFRFKPDPVIIYEVPADGEYVFSIRDGIYRGREDFVYRITAGELPYVTSIYPLGGRLGESVKLQLYGVNLGSMRLSTPPGSAGKGIHRITETPDGQLVNPIPFAVDTLPEASDLEPNNAPSTAQAVTLPVIVNGRIDQPGDWDIFRFTGKAGEAIVLDVMARRLDSPVDSTLKLIDAAGNLVASNDDHGEPGGGLNTHHADSYIHTKLPADGTYYVHLGDTTQAGGAEYGYRLRIGAPQPDFELRVVPSSISVRNRSSGTVSVHAIRFDGFSNPITLSLPGLPRGIAAAPVVVVGTQEVAKVTVKANWQKVNQPFCLVPTIIGSAFVSGRTPTHKPAVPAEDRMQAFLWRHLVPAADFKVHIFNPSYKAPSGRAANISPDTVARIVAEVRKKQEAKKDAQPVSKGQTRGRLLDLYRLFNAGLLTDEFYFRKVAEARAAEAD